MSLLGARVVTAIVFVVAAAGLTIAPIWPTRSMVRAQVVGEAGDRISYPVHFASLPEQVELLRYDGPADRPRFVVGGAIVALGLAGVAAALTWRGLAGRAGAARSARAGDRAAR